MLKIKEDKMQELEKFFVYEHHTNESVFVGNAIDRLAELEDVLEKYGIKNAEELDKFIYHKDCQIEKWKQDYENCSKLEKSISKEHQYCLDNWRACENKLADSEKQIKDAREAANMAVDSWCKNRRKYEAQIAEMQNKSFILYSMLCETLEKQGCDNVASQIDQMTGWTYDKEADWLKGNRNYDQLKQQLAEKDKEIKQLKQSQKQLAIKELEKALVLIQNAVNLESPEYGLVGLYDAIVDQIKSLKGEE